MPVPVPKHSLSGPAWTRLLLVAALAAATLVPLGREHTSVGFMIPGVLEFFWRDGLYWLGGLGLTWLLMRRLGWWDGWQRLVGRLWGAMLRRPFAAAGLIALLTLAVTVGMCAALYGFVPRFPDSIAHYVHARIFAQGELAGEGQPMREFFDMMCAISWPRFISHYLPGHTILLALGQLAHVPWLVNPLIGAASLLATFSLARETHGVRVALTAALLMAISPFFLFMSAEFMNHATSMLFTTLFLLCVVRARRRRHVGYALAAGLCLGYALFTRPFNAVLIGYPVAVYGLAWALAAPKPQRGTWLKMLGACALGVIFFVPLVLKYNALTTGDALTFGYDLTMLGKYNTIGFGPVPESIRPWVMASSHTIWRGVLYTSNNLIGLNFFLLRWPLPALFLVALPFLLRGRNEWNLIYLTTACCLLLGYILYYHQGWHFGPRYVYEAAPLLLILAAAGLHRLYAYLRFFYGARVRRTEYRALLTLAALTAFAAGLPTWMPRHNIDGATVPYRGAYHLALEKKLHHALIFVSDIEYITASVANPPSDEAGLIIARDHGDAHNRRLMDRYPTRRVWRITDDRKLILLRNEQAGEAVSPSR